MDLLTFLPPLFSGIIGAALCVLIARKPKGKRNELSLKLLLWFFIMQTISALFTAFFFGVGYTVESIGNPLIFYIFTVTYQISYILMWALCVQLKYSSGMFQERKYKVMISIFSILFLINDLFMIGSPYALYISYIGVITEFILAVWSVTLLILIRIQMKKQIERKRSLLLIIGIIFALILTNIVWYFYQVGNLDRVYIIVILTNVFSAIGLILIFLSYTIKFEEKLF